MTSKNSPLPHLAAQWIEASKELPEPGSGPVLVVYLDAFFGGFFQAFGVAYFDGPDGYVDLSDAEGWVFPHSGEKLRRVTHWARLPEFPEDPRARLTQEEFEDRYTTLLGTVVEK